MEITSISVASDPWYVVYCKLQKEFFAASILHRQLGLTVYLPEMEIRLRKEVQRVPFFPGYFFVQADLQRIELKRINACPGVLKLLDFGDGPLAVPPTLIELLREEIKRCNIYSQDSLSNLTVGDSVRITNGPFKGLHAVFVEALTSGERVHVLLQILGRLSKVQIDSGSLEKVQNGYGVKKSHDLPDQRRKTRGKGRKINYRYA